MKPVLVSTPAGTLAVGATATAVVMCDYTHSPHFSSHCNDCATLECDKSMTDTAVTRLLEYFAGTRTAFNIPVAPAGTPFRQKVWAALAEIPYGSTVSYTDIAAAIGQPRAVRAVAQAIASNPINIILPCHRVVGKNGQLTGYAGGIAAKKLLLRLEKEHSDSRLYASADICDLI